MTQESEIDVHPIPANPAKGEPDHQHFDLRCGFTTTATPHVELQADEVSGFAWLPVADIEPAALRKKITAAAAAGSRLPRPTQPRGLSST